MTPLSIEDLDRAAASHELEDRTRAMQALLIRVRRDASLGPAALPIFRRVVALEKNGWTASLAARGVEEIEGPEAGRRVWMALLDRESPQIVASATQSATDPLFLPTLMDLLHRRPEPEVRGAVIRALGRIREDSVFPAIIGFLDDPALRVSVVEALADQGDERARPHLMALVDDQTETGEWDDRGAPVRIGSLAWSAIRRFDEPDYARHFWPANDLQFNDSGWGDPVPPLLGGPPPFRIEPRPEPTAAPAAPAISAAPAPPAAIRRTPSAPASPQVRQSSPVRWPATFMGFRLIALLPMALAIFEVFWAVGLIAMLAEAIRVGEDTILRSKALNVLGMIPGVLGALSALVIPFVSRLKTLEVVALVVGALACLPLVVVFGMELL